MGQPQQGTDRPQVEHRPEQRDPPNRGLENRENRDRILSLIWWDKDVPIAGWRYESPATSHHGGYNGYCSKK
jgi:hypothetical protein